MGGATGGAKTIRISGKVLERLCGGGKVTWARIFLREIRERLERERI